MTRNIPFGRPWITDDERKAVLEVLAGDVLTHGPQGHEFEKEFAAFVGPQANCVSLSSGMASLHLSYYYLGIGPGDEVIVPAQTHIATVHAAEFVGARPVFADCDARTGNITAAAVEKLITPRTKAIGLVHFLGIPCDMDPIMEIARAKNLKVVEDCAIAIGATYRGKHVGLFGDAGCFSFYPVKHITTGDGGMYLSRHKEATEKVGKIRAFGVDRSFAQRAIPGMYDVPDLGLNYRMSDINASIGRQQIKKLPEILSRRAANFAALKAALSGLADVTIIDSVDPACRNSHYCLSAVLGGKLGPKRNDVVAALKAAGLGTSVYYPQPTPRMTYYRNKYGYDESKYPNAARISDCSIALPVGPHLNVQDMEYIGQLFSKTVKEIA
ncbi:MAG: DegT/DnrJ/EryC1/StrS family aminotransferase [Planctomycetes bacterium]|nr:DegT/DnrJ/EryC1/StrS family aminotransferase [Planctomycetota bacterium]